MEHDNEHQVLNKRASCSGGYSAKAATACCHCIQHTHRLATSPIGLELERLAYQLAFRSVVSVHAYGARGPGSIPEQGPFFVQVVVSTTRFTTEWFQDGESNPGRELHRHTTEWFPDKLWSYIYIRIYSVAY